MKKLTKLISNVILILLLALVAVLFLPRIIGLKPLAVLSGSMEPTYHVGSLIYVKQVEPSQIQVGDAMTYKISEDTMVTHRVVAKDEAAQTFQTKGDANEVTDGGQVNYTNVVGIPLFTIPLLGYVAVYASGRTGMIVIATAVMVLLLLTWLTDLLGAKDAQEKKQDHSENGKPSRRLQGGVK